MIVMDDRFGGDEAPGVYRHTEEDTLERCDPASLEIAGTVSNAGLRDVVALLRKVDRYSRRPAPSPQPEPVETPELPGSSEEPGATEETDAPEEPGASEEELVPSTEGEVVPSP
jgi:hypothetical protein